jgi:Rod binding domain-containing protein
MTTHPLQFGRHPKPTHSHIHSHPTHSGGRYVSTHPKSSGDPHHDAVVKQAQKWVAQTFYGEMLRQMRNDPLKSKLMHGTGGQAFEQMFDQKIAEKMSSGTGRKLVDSIVNKIEAQKAYGKGSKLPEQSTAKADMISDNLLSKIGGVK